MATRTAPRNTDDVLAAEPPESLDAVVTPAAVVDLPRMRANIQRMGAYAREHALALRPHIKTHKTPELAALQLEHGAAGITVATPREALVMAEVCDDILLAYPPVGAARLAQLDALPSHVRLGVALDSLDALAELARRADRAGRTIHVRVEVDLGMRRVGVCRPEHAIDLARAAADSRGTAFDGINFYPGHIREPFGAMDDALERLNTRLAEFLDALEHAGLRPSVVSGGSTPTAFLSHRVRLQTEIRPGTYIFNDRVTLALDACRLEDCAYTVLATVVSTAVPGQAVVDAGSKALNREEVGPDRHDGYGVLLDRPDVRVARMSEEHGVLDLAGSDWRPRVGDRVRIVPNHVCVSVNLHDRLWTVEHGRIVGAWRVTARNWG